MTVHQGIDPPLGTVGTSLGRTEVAHRLALAIVPVDAVTRRAAPPGVRVGRETTRSLVRRPNIDPQRLAIPVRASAAYILLHDPTIPPQPSPLPNDPSPVRPPEIALRLTDPAGRFVPRRFTVPIWTLGEIRRPDAEPPSGPVIPAMSRSIRPWLMPGAAYGVPGGATGIRTRVLREGEPARWARVELFDAAGNRLGWGHCDEHGQVLVLLDRLGSGIPSAPVDIAIRIHVPSGDEQTVGNTATDPLWDLVREPLPREPLPPPPPVQDDVTIGVAVPDGYLTSAQDVVRPVVPGRITALADVIFTP
ncbi:hypothetical protein EV645_6531 [Kribbella rubisoli]|uniref:Uncharacterized protein n=1 Tax=Kribbella rubisoli TaxID=3075929 RepID=A0A4Q7WPE7_9ACTN|nr:hypothetical protein [Kribbella rubisoli]RZU11365.1 hypothetical protein EV645_6531 [Kribbella rubisoli]